jgi:hypothetical protein
MEDTQMVRQIESLQWGIGMWGDGVVRKGTLADNRERARRYGRYITIPWRIVGREPSHYFAD